MKKVKLEAVEPPVATEPEVAQVSTEPTAASPTTTVTEEELDADEAEFNKLRRDLPGVKGASAVGIVTITVAKAPPRNEFFRTHPTFCPEVQLVQNEEGMENHFYAVDTDMEVPLVGIGIHHVKHRLYMIVTPRGSIRIIPINCESDND